VDVVNRPSDTEQEKYCYAPNFIPKKKKKRIELIFELAITFSMPSSGLFVNASFE